MPKYPEGVVIVTYPSSRTAGIRLLSGYRGELPVTGYRQILALGAAFGVNGLGAK